LANSSNEDKLKEYRKYLQNYQVISSDISQEEPESDLITITRYKVIQNMLNGFVHSTEPLLTG
jgi:hypothetical protein